MTQSTQDDVVARLVDVHVHRGSKRVIAGVSLEIRRGRILALLGPSGAGKTTLMNVLAGELNISHGRYDTGGHDLSLGFVHQSPLLFPWLTVQENVRLGHTFAVHRDVPDALVEEMIDLLGLDNVRHSYPDQISGGQSQRTALARALAVNPDLIMLDEPFSALDPHTRGVLQSWVRDQVHEAGWTGVIVTHDIDEALILADDIVLISDGRLTHSWTNSPSELDEVLDSSLPIEIRAAYAQPDVPEWMI